MHTGTDFVVAGREGEGEGRGAVLERKTLIQRPCAAPRRGQNPRCLL